MAGAGAGNKKLSLATEFEPQRMRNSQTNPNYPRRMTAEAP